MMSVAAAALRLRSFTGFSVILGNFSSRGVPWLCSTWKKRNKKREKTNVFKVEAVRGSTETRKARQAQSPESRQAYAPEEGDRESLGLQITKWNLGKKKKKKMSGREGWWSVVSFSWQWCMCCGKKLLCMCMFVKTEKLPLLKLQLKHQDDCWHRCFCSGLGNHIRWFLEG